MLCHLYGGPWLLACKRGALCHKHIFVLFPALYIYIYVRCFQVTIQVDCKLSTSLHWLFKERCPCVGLDTKAGKFCINV